jgi:sugar phosphate isomerase/epimerase
MHLSYCTNVHAAEDFDGILRQLDEYAVPIRSRLGGDVLGLGLWLAAPVAAALGADPAARKRLRSALDERGLEVVTLNGFPYQAFQAPVVKYAVYRPDWSTPQRYTYTMDLARVLIDLLPDEAAYGSISTLPLAWREPWDAVKRDACRRAVDDLARDLRRLDGRVRVGFEPEPGCVVETTYEAVELLGGTDPEVIGVCLDLAHLACAWEEPAEAVGRLRDAGIPIVKTQVSVALESDDPRRDAAVLASYAEPRFLHQTRAEPRLPQQTRAALCTDDLDQALALGHGDDRPWRVHFHAPLHAEPVTPLRTTVGVLDAALEAILPGECEHFDVETYTWGVLPEADRPDGPAELADGIAAELSLAREKLGVSR